MSICTILYSTPQNASGHFVTEASICLFIWRLPCCNDRQKPGYIVSHCEYWCFRWLMMGIIGFSVGIVGFLLHQIIDIISEFKWELTSYYIQVTIKRLFLKSWYIYTYFAERRFFRCLCLHCGLLRHLRGGQLYTRPLPARGRRLRDTRNYRLS